MAANRKRDVMVSQEEWELISKEEQDSMIMCSMEYRKHRIYHSFMPLMYEQAKKQWKILKEIYNQKARSR